jgi:PilZ domain
MAETERRYYPRVKPPKTFLAAWQAGTRRGVSYLDSLSVGGLFVRTKEALPLRCLVQILLDLPLGQVRCRAIVRRVWPNHGFGVQIIAMEPSDRAKLFAQVRALLA